MSIWTTIGAPVVPSPAVPVISVGNLKGGVGKTTVVANLACALVRLGFRVLAIDLDFQASLSIAIPPQIIPRNEEGDGGANVLLGESYDMFHDTRVTAKGIKPYADLSLVRTSLMLADIEDRMFASFLLGQSREDIRFSLARKFIDPRLGRDFDIVLIDTPPRLTTASINALCASTHVLIPTALTPLAYNGAATFVAFLSEFRSRLCPRLRILGVLPTLTRLPLNPAELLFVTQIENDLPGVNVWAECAIPDRQPIADNKALANADAKLRFDILAQKVATELRLVPNGHNAGRRLNKSAEFGREILP